MVPYRHVALQPLLPFEKRLIEELGCSEQEYRAFVDHVSRHKYIRPAEYAGIPDVQNGALAVAIVSLVIGIASTAASILMAPKPRQPDQQRNQPQFSSRDLGSRTASDIFTPSYGFSSLQELAAYGTVVPIVFTRRSTNVDDDGEFYTGGVLVSPAMVWSRVKSWGSHQISELVTIAGQGPMSRPDLAGVFLGNNALDNIFAEYFDFYWNDGSVITDGASRLRGRNLRYGSLAIDDGQGDADQAFYAPTFEGSNQPAFSGAFTPSNQIRFGVYSGIANGTPVRPDWEVISVLKDWDYTRKFQMLIKQKKYVDLYLKRNHPYGGDYQRNGITENAGMPGTGVNYARRIGVIEHRSASTGAITTHTETRVNEPYDTTAWENLTTEVEVNKGDQIVVLYGKGRQNPDPFPVEGSNADPPKVEDIRSTVDAEVQRADQLLALGATFMIGRTAWIVIDRPTETYDPQVPAHREKGFKATLRCIEAWSNQQRKIGIVAEAAITEEGWLPNADIDEAFYPLLRFEMGSFQNNRRCDVTEIGLKSQVWTRFNGITNFNTLATPGEMAQENGRNVELRGGKMTQYAKRLSVFALDARPANNETVRDYNRNEGWVSIGGYLFGVTGDSPVDIYSFIRITHPERSQLEFRLRPFNAAIFAQQSKGEDSIFLLDGGRPGYQEWTSDTYMGTFRIGGRGNFVKPRDYFKHSQMAVRPETESGEDQLDKLQYGYYEPDPTRPGVVPRQITCVAPGPGVFSNYSTGDAITNVDLNNIMASFFGEDPETNDLPVGTRRTQSGWTYARDSQRTMDLTLTVEVYRDESTFIKRRSWKIVEVGVNTFTGTWNSGDTFGKYARVQNVVRNSVSVTGAQFAFTYAVELPGRYVEYDEPIPATRLFQKYSGIAEISHYGELITHSCDGSPEHEVVYVNECLSEDSIPEYQKCAVAGLKLRSSDNFQQLDQLRCYVSNGIQVERLIDGDTASSNLLTDLLWYLATDKDTGAGSIINRDLLDRAQLVETGRYLRANNFLFDAAVAEPLNIRSWLGQIAPTVLCYPTLKNGRLAIEPALPYDSNYKVAPDQALAIKGMFTDGNILEDSLSIEWIELEERKLFQAAIVYNWSGLNKFPEQQTIVVRYRDTAADQLPLEQFEFSHITSDSHATTLARYYLALRKHVTHTVTFKTLPWGLSLAPGDYIRVATEISPYSPTNNGIVREDGSVVSITPLADGNYTVYYWDRSQTTIETGTLEIVNGEAQSLRNTVFSVIDANVTSQVYQIEAIDLDGEGIVTIKASNHPVNSSGASLIARDTLDVDNQFEVLGGPAD